MNCLCQNQRVIDPAQRDLFTQMEVRSKYNDGYETGLKWDASWMPGVRGFIVPVDWIYRNVANAWNGNLSPNIKHGWTGSMMD